MVSLAPFYPSIRAASEIVTVLTPGIWSPCQSERSNELFVYFGPETHWPQRGMSGLRCSNPVYVVYICIVSSCALHVSDMIPNRDFRHCTELKNQRRMTVRLEVECQLTCDKNTTSFIGLSSKAENIEGR
ncbi:hypothetical protein J6590_106924 [Homalodisca vitripennis]|nr:hypothetical protein J6590_106924 [Homalodisca vitripennis]